MRCCWLTLCTVWLSQSQWPRKHTSFIMTMHLPILQLLCRVFGKASHQPGLSALLQPRFGFLWLLVFSKAKIIIESEVICECDSRTVHKLSQRRLSANWLAPWESDCSYTHSKVSSDWLPSYIKAMWSVLKILKLDGYFPARPHTQNSWKSVIVEILHSLTKYINTKYHLGKIISDHRNYS